MGDCWSNNNLKKTIFSWSVLLRDTLQTKLTELLSENSYYVSICLILHGKGVEKESRLANLQLGYSRQKGSHTGICQLLV